MLKKLIYFLLITVTLVTLAYIFQPLKKGTGYDSTIRYEPVENWLHLPGGCTLGNPTALAIDTSEQLVVFHRSERKWPLLGAMPDTPIRGNTILIIDKNKGRLINSWAATCSLCHMG